MPRRTAADPRAAAVGGRVRALREAGGWTLERVAFESGLGSKGHLSSLERGLVMPTVATLDTLAGRLGVEAIDLLIDPATSDRHRLIELTRHLPAPSLRRLVTEAQNEVGPTRGLAPLRGDSLGPLPPLRLLRGRRRPPGAAVPLYDLQLAAGALCSGHSPEPLGWVRLSAREAEQPDAFVAQVHGRSMEPRIPDGAFCLFRRPGPGNRSGRVFVVEERPLGSPNDGGAYVLKLIERVRLGGRELLALRPLNRDFQTVLVDPARSELRIVAELVRVLALP